MSSPAPTRVGVIGTGLMARHHLRTMLDRDDTVVAAVCEPSEAAWAIAATEFTERGLAVPPNEPDWQALRRRASAPELDAALIVTPHALHHDQTVAFLEAGVDVLLEKPMVLTRPRRSRSSPPATGPAGCWSWPSPAASRRQVRTAAAMIKSRGARSASSTSMRSPGRTGTPSRSGTWRQVPELSGGGFLFDTGAHMLNTVADLAGEDVTEVAAWLVDDGAPVDLRGVVMARIASGGARSR